MRTALSALACLLFTATATAQGADGATIARATDGHRLVRFAGVPDSEAALASVSRSLGLSDAHAWRAHREHTDRRGARHERFRQVYRGVPVLGGEYVVHHYPSGRTTATGRAGVFDGLDAQPTLSEGDAVVRLRQNRLQGARHVVTETAAEGVYRRVDSLRAYHPGEAAEVDGEASATRLVVVDRAYPRRTGDYRLAYEITVETADARERRAYYLDAHSGELLTDVPLVAEHNGVEGSGQTTYYGNRAFVTDSLAADRYRLHDPSRGEGNSVYLDELGADIEHGSRDFGAEVPSVAIDVHWGTAAFYDMMEERFGWRGLDGEGKALQSVVYSDTENSFVNAFWNGTNAAFGNGNCHYTPLTAIDVVAHEFMHGVTDYTSDLVYRDESGALNEAMSDIFGKALEHDRYPEGFSWEIGAQFSQSRYARSFRSMADPHERNHPKYYLGENWSQSGRVHTNSSVLNHWFYLLVEGGAGTDEAGRDYDVAALGWDATLEHVFAIQRDYLTPDGTYPDAHAYSLEIAEAVYGETSDEYASIAEAWAAVGLTADGGPQSEYEYYLVPDLDLREIFFGCYDGGGLVLPLLVQNLGNRTFLAGETVEVLVEDENEVYPEFTISITLDGSLAYGETLSQDVPTAWVYGPDEYVDVRFRVPDNDFDVPASAWGYSFSAPEVETTPLSVYLPSVRDACAWDTVDYRIEVYNGSCTGETQAANAGTVTLLDEDGRALRTLSFTTPELGLYEAITIESPYPIAELAEVTGYRFELDSGESSGEVQLWPRAETLPVKRDLVGIGLDTEYDLREEVTVNGYDDLGVVDYRNKPYWGTVGSGTVEWGFPCVDAAATLRSTYPNSLNFCVDFDTDAAVELSAEVLRLSSSRAPEYADISDNFGIVAFSYRQPDGESASSLHNGLPDRRARRLSTTLPAGYRGPVQISTYNYLGEGRWDFDGSFRDSSDYTLVRDLRFETDAVGTDDTGVRVARLAPNPSTTSARLTLGEADGYAVRVLDALGRTVAQARFEGLSTELDVRDWPTGSYTVEAVGERSGVRWRGRLVR